MFSFTSLPTVLLIIVIEDDLLLYICYSVFTEHRYHVLIEIKAFQPLSVMAD
jgi:hypothetical protein